MEPKKSGVLILLLLGVFLIPVLLVPLALRYGPVGLGIVAMSMMGMSLVLYTKLALKGRSKKNIEWGTAGMNPPEKRLFIIGYTMLVAGILTLLLLWHL